MHKGESDVQELDEEPNPSKILGLMWDKREDTLEIQLKMNENSSVTKRSILSQLSAIYDPLGVISPTIVGGAGGGRGNVFTERFVMKRLAGIRKSAVPRGETSGTSKYLEV